MICMKILLYFEGENIIAKSGIGRAFDHQTRALRSVGIPYTTDPWAEDYDILHINTYSMNSSAVIRRARSMGKKVIYHAHSTEEDFRNSFILSNAAAPLFKRHLMNLYSKADALITPTPYAKKLLQGYGLNMPIYPISNGIDLQKYKRDPNKIMAYRKYFSLNEDEKVIIGTGMLFKRKGIEDFVKTAKLLPKYKFIWFGDTPRAIIPRKMTRLVEDHPDNVLFPGYVKGGIIEGAYADADCFFFPSFEETEGIVVLEALAAGIQVVIRDIPVYADWLKNGVDCYKGHTSEEFASIIKNTINGKLPSTAEEGFKRAEERSIENIGLQLKQVYEEVLSH